MVSRILSSLLVLLAVTVRAGDSSGAASSIQTWHDLAGTVSGDTYTITSSETITTEIQITKGVTIKGQGKGVTILTDNVTSNQSVFEFDTDSTEGVYRLEDITFRAHSTPVSGNDGTLKVKGDGVIAFGRLEFESDLEKRSLYVVQSAVTGVVYDCEGYQATQFAYIRHEQWGGGSQGDGSWEAVVDWGSTNFLFFEDNIIAPSDAGRDAIDGDGGMRVVYRFNSNTNSSVGNHGTESSAPKRGGRALEVYGNTFSNPSGDELHMVVVRSGSALVYSNTATGLTQDDVYLTSYRRFLDFPTYGSADGTMLWDENDTTDGAGTPGGAGDGVFESGTSTSGSTGTLTDSGQSWTTDEWVGYTLRQVESFTSTSGGVDSITVSGAGWTTNEWVGFVVTRDSDNKKSQVESNTSDTLTLRGPADWESLTFGSSDDFELSRGSVITGNTATTITVNGQGGYLQPTSSPTSTARRESGGDYIFTSGDGYEIRRVLKMLDQSGRGQSDAWSGTRPTHEDLGQHSNSLDPCYEWENTSDGADLDFTASGYTFDENTDFYNDTEKPSYSMATYPHPLRSAVARTIKSRGGTNGFGIGF